MHRTHSPNTTDCYHINIESRRENNYVLFSWNTCASKWCKRLLATEWCNLINEKRFNMDCEGFFLLLMLLWMSTRWWVCFFLSTFQAFIVVIPSFIPSVLQKSVWIRWCCALLPNMVLFPTCYFSAYYFDVHSSSCCCCFSFSRTYLTILVFFLSGKFILHNTMNYCLWMGYRVMNILENDQAT